MSDRISHSAATAVPMTRKQRMVAFLEDPLGQILAATTLALGSLGVVISGIWFVSATIA
ncbi:MAG: hypothetical protein AAGI11_18690 [Pseudomonadota bacterium]